MTYGGATANHIARLNADSTMDTTFTTGTGAGGYAYTVSLQPDGKILITTPAYSTIPTETIIGYKLDIPTTQQAGIYQGAVTYQVTVNP